MNTDGWKFQLGEMVCKKPTSSWAGYIVGFYSTEITPRGYCVIKDRRVGPVQIYPESALEPRS